MGCDLSKSNQRARDLRRWGRNNKLSVLPSGLIVPYMLSYFLPLIIQLNRLLITAQLHDLLQLKQENSYLTTIARQIGPYILSIAKVKERLEPRLVFCFTIEILIYYIWIFYFSKGIINENLQEMFSPSGYPRCRWVCFFTRTDSEKFSITSLAYQSIRMRLKHYNNTMLHSPVKKSSCQERNMYRASTVYMRQQS